MTLAPFIRSRMAHILAEWTAFAEKAAPRDGAMSALALTDHAEEILLAIASDIETAQSKQEQYDKSQGDDTNTTLAQSAAAVHGGLRHADNFSLLQLSSEFRALRATVLRLWLPQIDVVSASSMDEMVRFNEAIDQALAESIVTYSARADRTRDLFLAVLGHDLRAPLATVLMVGDLLERGEVAADQASTLGNMARRSAKLMGAMVTDILGYARLQMGAGMPTVRAPDDLHAVCEGALADACSMYPASRFDFQPAGELTASFDGVRIQQLITNLLINAAQYSSKGHPVTLVAQQDATTMTIKVNNHGAVIPQEALQTIFQPLVQLDPDAEESTRPKTSLGLGLFIARETAKAHDGTITVSSDAHAGTTFTVSFPRAS